MEANNLKNFDIHKLIDDAMEKKDRSVTIFFGKHGTSVSVYPITDDVEEAIEIYE